MDVSKLYERAEEAIKRKNFDYAVDILAKQILPIYPNDVKARKLLRGTVIRKCDEKGLPLAFPRRIEHAQLVHPDDLPRFARAGVLASMQPSHLFIDLEILERCLPDRCERAFALASLRQAGVEIAFGSDAPIENPDPRRGLFAAVARTRLDGHPEGGWHRAEALRIGDAIDAYTRGGAVAAGVEHRQGTIAPGADADLVVLDRDPGTIQTTEILEMGVRRTLVAGRDTHVA